jgi:hypothetical protein
MPFFNSTLFESKPKLLNGNLQIIACAGSGKTEFVSERIAYMIYKGVAKPEQIVAFTFTDKAAEELKFRVRSKIQELLGKQPDIGDMYIGTIHAFAFKILQDFIPRYRAYDMLDEVGRLAFLSSIKRDIDFDYLFNSLHTRYRWNFHRHGNKQNWSYRTFIKDVDLFREEGLADEATLSDSFRNALKIYLQKLEEKRFLDFSSILRIAVDTLENEPSVRKKLQDQYSFFTVDEYQDVNPIQEKLIQLISNKQNVCVVGDDDQSIYQWRGADVQNIITFQKRYPKVAVHQLDINRRSSDAIVKTADELIQLNNPGRLKKSIKDKGLKSEKGDLYKITKQYVKFNAFGKEVDLESLAVRRTLANPAVSNKIMLLIGQALGEHFKVKTEVKVTNYPINLMKLDGFYWKRDHVQLKKTVFNYTPVYNELEKGFAKFLEQAEDINKFAALAETFTKFNIPYLNKKGSQGLYYPDFIAEQELKKGKTINWIIETKGFEDENVQYKDAETENWCKVATKHTDIEWKFLKVPDQFFKGLKTLPLSFEEMTYRLETFNRNTENLELR